jgi:hypothetical protein
MWLIEGLYEEIDKRVGNRCSVKKYSKSIEIKHPDGLYINVMYENELIVTMHDDYNASVYCVDLSDPTAISMLMAAIEEVVGEATWWDRAVHAIIWMARIMIAGGIMAACYYAWRWIT